jgi:hypothetical protein
MDWIVVILFALAVVGIVYAIFSDFGVRGWEEVLDQEEDETT